MEVESGSGSGRAAQVIVKCARWELTLARAVNCVMRVQFGFAWSERPAAAGKRARGLGRKEVEIKSVVWRASSPANLRCILRRFGRSID